MGDFLSFGTDGNAELPFGTQTGQRSGKFYIPRPDAAYHGKSEFTAWQGHNGIIMLRQEQPTPILAL